MSESAPAAMLAPGFGEGLVGSLHDALAADVDPRSRRHLAEHHQALAVELVEVFPRRPFRHEVGIGDEHARRIRVGLEDADRLARLDQQRLVVAEFAQRRDDRIEAFPVARSAPDAAVDDELLWILGDLGVEVVVEHPQRGFGEPALRRALGAARRADHAIGVSRPAAIGVHLLRVARCMVGLLPVGPAVQIGAKSAKSPRSTRMRIASRSGANARSRSQNVTSARIIASAARSGGEVTKRLPQVDTLRGSDEFDRHDARGVRRHRSQSTRGEGRHADVVLLVGGGRQRIDRRRMRERFVLGCERGRCHVRDHETGIHTAILDQERWKSGQVRIHHQRDPPLGQRADLGDRQREIVGCERDRLGVKIAAGEYLCRYLRRRADCPTPHSLR